MTMSFCLCVVDIITKQEKYYSITFLIHLFYTNKQNKLGDTNKAKKILFNIYIMATASHSYYTYFFYVLFALYPLFIMFGRKTAAKKSSKCACQDCTDCGDCSGCNGCNNCSECTECSSCKTCAGCQNCKLIFNNSINNIYSNTQNIQTCEKHF